MCTFSMQPALLDFQEWVRGFLSTPGGEEIQFAWVGQAGFLLKTPTATIGIDLYLSDSLANKYRGSLSPHTRMIQPPCSGSDLQFLDLVLSTHGHTDHLDPDTLREIYQTPGKERPLLVCPRSEVSKAIERNVPWQRIVGLDHSECWALHPGVAIHAIAAAHEELQADDWGNNHYLGYVIEVGALRVYHAGDCVPYHGLSALLRSHNIDVALLPVNGRDTYRREHGIAGNFTMDEALVLCEEANIRYLIPHHYGMFDFNTVSMQEIEAVIQKNAESSVTVVMVEVGAVMEICAI